MCNIPIAIRAINSADDVVNVSANMLRALADFHGPTLEKCDVVLALDVFAADLQYFISRCPNMVELLLEGFDPRGLIDDAGMRNLPLWCPRISKLKLYCCAEDITDEALCFALEKWSANGITLLDLYRCQLLTDAVLPVIERCCPRLVSLSLQAKVSKEALLQFVLSISKNKVFSLVEPGGWHLRDWLKAELKTHAALWKKVAVK